MTAAKEGEAYPAPPVMWHPGLPSSPPPRGEIHLWRCHLGRTPGDSALLAPDERSRLARLIRPEVRRRWLAARTFLRRVLGASLGVPPEAIGLSRQPGGKPFLPDSDLQFNLSHSGDWALLALAWQLPLGVDIETIRPPRQPLAIARRFFSPEATAALAQAPSEQQARIFHHHWTRLEALHKLGGGGLMAPPPEDARLLSFTPAPGCLGALAWPGGGIPRPVIRGFDFVAPAE